MYPEKTFVISYCPSIMKVVAKFRTWGVVVAFVFLFWGPSRPSLAYQIVELPPAYFEEGVGIYIFGWAVGTSTSVAESVQMSQTGDWGDGRGWGITGDTLPGYAETGLVLNGTGITGWGATAYAITRFQYAVVADNPLEVLPDLVPVILSSFGSVSVSTDLSSIGTTFARVTYPGGQFEASNADPYGSYQGDFFFEESVLLQAPVNTAQSIDMYVSTHGEGNSKFYYNSRAVADPVIVIDPEFEYREKFKIIYSEGMKASVGPVPEPATMVLLGTGLLGLMQLRRKFKKIIQSTLRGEKAGSIGSTFFLISFGNHRISGHLSVAG